MPAPDVNLEVGSGSHAGQTAEVMRRFEPVVLERKPDIVFVYGDVNSTVAAALVCSKYLFELAMLRLDFVPSIAPCRKRSTASSQTGSPICYLPLQKMPMSILSSRVFPEKIYRVGNVMIDSLVQLLPAIMRFPKNGLPQRFALVTLHRPSNVDDSTNLKNILKSLLEVNEQLEVIFPVHPRTRQRIEKFGINIEKLHLVEPLPYIEFLSLQRRAVVVITDSGGVQEETTYLGVPCLTLRSNTERPVTVSMGLTFWLGRTRGCLTRSWRGFSREKLRRDPFRRYGTVAQASGLRKFCRGIWLDEPRVTSRKTRKHFQNRAIVNIAPFSTRCTISVDRVQVTDGSCGLQLSIGI